MPLYEFQCVKCGSTRERLYPSHDAMLKETAWQCDPPSCTGFMQKIVSRSTFNVSGFSNKNGYSGKRTIRQRHANGIRTEVSGNFEAFSDGLHS